MYSITETISYVLQAFLATVPLVNVRLMKVIVNQMNNVFLDLSVDLTTANQNLDMEMEQIVATTQITFAWNLLRATMVIGLCKRQSIPRTSMFLMSPVNGTLMLQKIPSTHMAMDLLLVVLLPLIGIVALVSILA